MRNSQDESSCAHSQAQQLFSLEETRKVGAQLIFYERYGDLHVGELWEAVVLSHVNADKAMGVELIFLKVNRAFIKGAVNCPHFLYKFTYFP